MWTGVEVKAFFSSSRDFFQSKLKGWSFWINFVSDFVILAKSGSRQIFSDLHFQFRFSDTLKNICNSRYVFVNRRRLYYIVVHVNETSLILKACWNVLHRPMKGWCGTLQSEWHSDELKIAVLDWKGCSMDVFWLDWYLVKSLKEIKWVKYLHLPSWSRRSDMLERRYLS